MRKDKTRQREQNLRDAAAATTTTAPPLLLAPRGPHLLHTYPPPAPLPPPQPAPPAHPMVTRFLMSVFLVREN